MQRALLFIAVCGFAAIHQVTATAECPLLSASADPSRTRTSNTPSGTPKTCVTGEFCYSDGMNDDCYTAVKCAALDTSAGLVKSQTAPIKTTDPANCTTADEKCFNDGTTDACYAPPTTTMLTTAASSEATGSTAATGSTTASSEYTGSCVDSNTNCPTWTKNGFCTSSFYASQVQTCRKSCNLC
ncbi:unnamed protein product, partial [Mesorhabditis spiculigera]